MIRIVYDPHDLISHQETKVREISEYPAVIKHCLANLAEGNHQSIYLVVPVLLQWFKNMSSRYPQGTFIFETVDARHALEERWKVPIPASVTNEEILQTGLLTLDIQPQAGYSFEDTLLAHFYDPIFTAKGFPFTQVTNILNAFEPQRWKDSKAIPLLRRTLDKRLEEWKSKCHSNAQRQLVDWIAADPIKLKYLLMRFRVLQNYPAIADTLLGDSYPLLKELKLRLQDLPLEQDKISDAVLQVTYHLNNHHPENVAELSDLLERVSGLLAVEFDTIEKHLLLHPQWITLDWMDAAEDKFSSQSRQLAQHFKALRGLIQPPKPAKPDLNWDMDTMLSWASASYLPYQAWCDEKDQFDPELYRLGDRFSEWLMAHWTDLHANSGRMVFNILPQKAADLKRSGVVNLLLVVDNLGWSFAAELVELFLKRGYFLAEKEAYLAMLPSETEISKKCLLAGAVGYQAIDENTYKGMIEKGWVPYFHDHAFRYCSDIGSLKNIDAIDASTYVVNYLAVDKALHKSAQEIGMSHREHIHHLLEKLVKSSADFIEKHGLQERIRIHVVSDHGSTRIPAELQNDLDPAFFKTNGFEDRSPRYVTVSNERFASLADNLKVDCFFLPANDFMNPHNVLCARRANRFMPTNKDGYVHGGLLPEEVIVPYMVFEPAVVPLKNLTLLLRKNEFRYRLETIEVEIGNPNKTAVEHIQVSILNGNVVSEPSAAAFLKGENNALLQLKARFKQTSIAEEQTSLRLRVRFQERGEQHSFDTLLNISMKKMVEEKSADIFDD